MITLSGHLYLGAPPANTPFAHQIIGLYGADTANATAVWLANASTQNDGSYRLQFDTAQALYKLYTLRPAPVAGFVPVDAMSATGIVISANRIRFDHPATGSYPDNDF